MRPLVLLIKKYGTEIIFSSGGGHMSIYFFIHCLLTKKFRALRIGTIENKKKIDMSLLFIENISVLLRHNSCTIKVTL